MSCPKCGYCSHCGRSNQQYTYPYQQYYTNPLYYGQTVGGACGGQSPVFGTFGGVATALNEDPNYSQKPCDHDAPDHK